MRLLQFDSFYPAYLSDFYRQNPDSRSLPFDRLSQRLLEDRYGATHILEPVLRRDPTAQFVVCNDAVSQRRWAAEHGLHTHKLVDILLAQIEEHRAEVVYDMDTLRFGSGFLRRLPGCVQKKVCWHATVLKGVDLHGFDLCLTSQPPFVKNWETQGMRAAYATPSHDPAMTEYAANDQRGLDVSFAGSYTKLHERRKELLLAVAGLGESINLHLALMHPRFRPWLDVRILHRIPSPFPYLPGPLRKIAHPPVFGRQLYQLISNSKVAFNVATDIARGYFGNMRCFEAMGCGACLLSDDGIYPEGMLAGEHFVAYKATEDALQQLQALLREPERARAIGRRASAMLAERYSKVKQWERFQELVAAL